MSRSSPDTVGGRRGGQSGFTLVELMVVVLVVAVLLAIAVPVFLGAQERGKAREAASDARTALSAAKSLYTKHASYDDISTSVAALEGAEPGLDWQTTSSSRPVEVSVYAGASTAPGTTFGIAVMSRSGDCFYVRDDAGPAGGTTFGRVDDALPTACTGARALVAAASPSPGAAGW